WLSGDSGGQSTRLRQEKKSFVESMILPAWMSPGGFISSDKLERRDMFYDNTRDGTDSIHSW
ncbi:TPA: hypothetical protein ACILI2_004631, partial [Escherichia coli]